MAIIIDGKQVSENIKTEIALSVKDLLDKGLRAPHLAVVIAGDDGAALSYVSSIEKQCKGVGFISSVYHLSANTTEEEFLATIDFLNQDE
ncbi:MAG: bifunctional 5,10-methylene-tetrahydrofolate dehydrogenase/5,10-methylene-tetrahydrofolate cyclohydrolase, partial [Bacteroidales bacterium]|nr:bifunctional 5,10-methylene-tetrahydrofolate dehydrogenase/5,10-methylene-tetrahydrofolate cyclohydrolase [Bacteroidales bacterium]